MHTRVGNNKTNIMELTLHGSFYLLWLDLRNYKYLEILILKCCISERKTDAYMEFAIL